MCWLLLSHCDRWQGHRAETCVRCLPITPAVWVCGRRETRRRLLPAKCRQKGARPGSGDVPSMSSRDCHHLWQDMPGYSVRYAGLDRKQLSWHDVQGHSCGTAHHEGRQQNLATICIQQSQHLSCPGKHEPQRDALPTFGKGCPGRLCCRP